MSHHYWHRGIQHSLEPWNLESWNRIKGREVPARPVAKPTSRERSVVRGSQLSIKVLQPEGSHFPDQQVRFLSLVIRSASVHCGKGTTMAVGENPFEFEGDLLPM